RLAHELVGREPAGWRRHQWHTLVAMKLPGAWPTAVPQYNAFQAAVETFAPISLEEMDAVALLDRVDLKFLLTPKQLMAVLAPLAQVYRVLSVNTVRLNRYRTLYFDTPNFA